MISKPEPEWMSESMLKTLALVEDIRQTIAEESVIYEIHEMLDSSSKAKE